MGKPIKKIACVCGAAVASSMTGKYAINDYLEEHGVRGVSIDCYKIGDFDEFQDKVDLIVAMSKIYKHTDTPMISGVCYLTTVGMEETNEKILNMILESRK